MARDQFERAFGKSRPGGILCQGDAPDGCGKGITSKRCPARATRNFRPITSSNLSQSMNCVIASRPTGMMRRGCKNLNLIVHPRRAVANLVRRRNPISAAGIFSGKTPADRREINFRSNGGLVHSAEFFEPPKKRFASGVCKRSLQSRFPGPGAWPMTMTSLTIAPPETGVDFMRGQRRQRSNAVTC